MNTVENSSNLGAGDVAVGVPPRFDPTREMRFAVVMYGGVSLAIYINGAAQELLRLVRSTAPHTPRGAAETDPELVGHALLRDDELEGSEAVYRKVGQLLGRDLAGEATGGMPEPGDPIRTRFVVDILSGSSAGGINAVYLGKALAGGRGIGRLRELWMNEADVELLLNDKSSAPSKELPVSSKPRSLFNSQRMYWQLLDALDKMDGEESVFPSGTSAFVDELDVWLTATDLQGLLLPIELSDRTVWEFRHRNVFRFQYGTEYARGDAVNDFERADNPFLAFAARCTASFPFAFEPMALSDIDAVISCQPFGWYKQQQLGSSSERWAKYFPDYGEARYFLGRSFGDGGYLDNKPFTWATRNLRRRRRDLAVDRRLIYIEPDPGSLAAVPKNAPAGGLPPAQPDAREKPDALTNVLAATLSLPRRETIRDDLADLLERNRAIDELVRVRDSVERAASDVLAPFAEIPIADWRVLSAQDLFAQHGPLYAAYHRLKISQTVADLGRLASSALGFGDRSDGQEAMTLIVRGWVERHYPEDGRGEQSQCEFLWRFDVGYRARRLNFLLDRTTRLLSLDGDAFSTLAKLGEIPANAAWQLALRDWLYLIRPVLGDAIVTLRGRARLLSSAEQTNPLQPILSDLQITRTLVGTLLAATHDELATALETTDAPMTAMAEALANALSPLFARQRELIDGLLGLPVDPTLTGDASPGPTAASPSDDELPAATPVEQGEHLARLAIRHYWKAFETYDAILFPIGFGVVGEADRVEVIRISPADATSLVDEQQDGKRKLGGIALQHFGGFFDERWRRNDFLWGRLDTAERLITTLLPDSTVRDSLLEEAQLAILTEEFNTETLTPITGLVVDGLIAHRDDHPDNDSFVKNLTPEQATQAVAAASTPAAILDYYRNAFTIDRQPDTSKMLRILGRAMTISGRLFDGLSDRPQVGTAARWTSRAGSLISGIVALATGRNFASALARNALAIPFVAALLMLLLGWLFNSAPTSHAGWLILFATAAGWFAIGLVRDLLRRFPPRSKRGWLILAFRILAIVVLAFAVFAVLFWVL